MNRLACKIPFNCSPDKLNFAPNLLLAQEEERDSNAVGSERESMPMRAIIFAQRIKNPLSQ